MDQLSDQQRDDLLRYGFDEELQRRWQRDVSDGRLSKTTNAVSGDLLAPPPGTVRRSPKMCSPPLAAAAAAGLAAAAGG